MRRDFHPILLDYMRRDPTIHVVVGDLGFGMFDAIAKEFPNRFYNVGAAEQLMLGAAVGLAECGKIPVVYSITPFLLWRGAEWIRNYVNHEEIPVKFVGGGRDSDYHEDGFTHFAGDDRAILSCWSNIRCYWPATTEEMKTVTDNWLYNGKPSYLNLKR